MREDRLAEAKEGQGRRGELLSTADSPRHCDAPATAAPAHLAMAPRDVVAGVSDLVSADEVPRNRGSAAARLTRGRKLPRCDPRFETTCSWQVRGKTPEALAVAKTVALLRQLNQLTARSASVCEELFDEAARVQGRVAGLSARVKAAARAAGELSRARAAGLRPIEQLEYDVVEADPEAARAAATERPSSLPRLGHPAPSPTPAWARSTQMALDSCEPDPTLECPEKYSDPGFFEEQMQKQQKENHEYRRVAKERKKALRKQRREQEQRTASQHQAKGAKQALSKKPVHYKDDFSGINGRIDTRPLPTHVPVPRHFALDPATRLAFLPHRTTAEAAHAAYLFRQLPPAHASAVQQRVAVEGRASESPPSASTIPTTAAPSAPPPLPPVPADTSGGSSPENTASAQETSEMAAGPAPTPNPAAANGDTPGDQFT